MAVQDFTLTQEYLQSLFDYRDGELYWKNTIAPRAKKGTIAGSVHHTGYKYLKLNGKVIANHRVIFFMHHGYLPKEIDHQDRNRSNNKIENLRAATTQQNALNRTVCNTSKSGIRGVFFNEKINKWMVQLNIDKKQKYFGSYYDLNVAKFVAEFIRHKYHKDFSNLRFKGEVNGC
jgi:hypothetical protein